MATDGHGWPLIAPKLPLSAPKRPLIANGNHEWPLITTDGRSLRLMASFIKRASSRAASNCL